MESGDLFGEDRDPRCLGDRRWQQSFPEQVIEENLQLQQEVSGMLPESHSLLMGLPAELWRAHRTFEEASGYGDRTDGSTYASEQGHRKS